MPIVDTCLIGVSTSLDTNGKGNQFNIRTTAETAATPSTTATIVCQTRGGTLPKWRAPMRLPRHLGGNSRTDSRNSRHFAMPPHSAASVPADAVPKKNHSIEALPSLGARWRRRKKGRTRHTGLAGKPVQNGKTAGRG